MSVLYVAVYSNEVYFLCTCTRFLIQFMSSSEVKSIYIFTSRWSATCSRLKRGSILTLDHMRSTLENKIFRHGAKVSRTKALKCLILALTIKETILTLQPALSKGNVFKWIRGLWSVYMVTSLLKKFSLLRAQQMVYASFSIVLKTSITFFVYLTLTHTNC